LPRRIPFEENVTEMLIYLESKILCLILINFNVFYIFRIAFKHYVFPCLFVFYKNYKEHFEAHVLFNHIGTTNEIKINYMPITLF